MVSRVRERTVRSGRDDYYEQDDSKVRFRARDYGQYPWGRTTKGGAADADNDALKDVTQALGLYVNNAAAAKGN